METRVPRKEKREMHTMNKFALLGSAACLTLGSSLASAVTLPPVVLSFAASSNNGSGSYDVTIDQADVFYIGTGFLVTWSATSDIDIMDTSGSFVLATINASTTVSMGFGLGQGFIDLNMSGYAGNMDSLVSVTSGDLNFALSAADVQYDASVNFTDSFANGLLATGLNTGNFATSSVNGGVFQDIIGGPLSASGLPGDQSVGGSEVLPPIFVGAVNSMSIGLDFELTADDQFAATASILAIPTPGAAALLGLGGLVATRRRR